MRKYLTLFAGVLWLAFIASAFANDTLPPLQLDDVFELEFASDPQPSPDGKQVVFVRNWMDRQSDRARRALWIMNADGSNLQALTDRSIDAASPRWSPDGKQVAYLSGGQLNLMWLDTGRTTQLTTTTGSPGSFSWSPDGKWIAFAMFTPKAAPLPVQLPGKPAGANWAAPVKYIDSEVYRIDGAGYVASGYQQLYLVSAEGGSAIQLTEGDVNHGGPVSWHPSGKSLFFSANLHEDKKTHPSNSEIYELNLASKEIKALTDRLGPDTRPAVSPDGKYIAYLGNDERYLANQNTRLYVMNIDGTQARGLTDDLDRSVSSFEWQTNSKSIVFAYDDHGLGVIAEQPLKGKRQVRVTDMGGVSYSRPYTGGQFALNNKGHLYYTKASTQHPAELALQQGKTNQQITHFNQDLLASKAIGQVEAVTYQSTVDKRSIQGWVIYPPGFDKTKKYPLILEIHGGPHAAYGPIFGMELQLMAAKGYVVLYTNPRGSTSYGEDFANTIHHNYPSDDYQDLMDGVDTLLARGFINEDELFVTGGSGGGALTAWTVGHTDRFAAAVAVNPVINWFSFVLNADMYPFFSKYWFPDMPWEIPEHYLKHSPIAYVGNVTTPTMLFTGEADHRTPISETEQFYQALQLKGVDTAMVRVPGASHALHLRPSNMMAKPAYITYWFDKYRKSLQAD